MIETREMDAVNEEIYNRVRSWISKHDFKEDNRSTGESETGVTWDVSSDLTSITRSPHLRHHHASVSEYAGVKVEQRTDVVTCDSPTFQSSNEELAELVKALKNRNCQTSKEPVKKHSAAASKFNMKSVSAPPATFSVIVEGEESELPESNKRSEFSFKTIKTSVANSPLKRHVDDVVATPKLLSCSLERKQRKRRTLDRIGPSMIYSRWFLPLMEAVFVGILLLTFDVYVNPEQYYEKPTALFIDYFWTYK